MDEIEDAQDHIRIAHAHLVLAEVGVKEMPTILAELRTAQALLEDLVGMQVGVPK